MYLSLEAVAYENNIDFLEVVSKALASRVPIFFELKYPDKLMVKTGFLKDWLLYGIRLKLKKHELYAGQFKPSFFDKEGVTVCILQEGMFRIIKGRGGIGATRLSDNGSLVWLDLIEGVVDKATYSIPLGYGKMKDAVPPPAEGIEPKYLSILECDEKELYSVLGISSLEILKDKKNAENIIKTNNKQSQKHQVKREEMYKELLSISSAREIRLKELAVIEDLKKASLLSIPSAREIRLKELAVIEDLKKVGLLSIPDLKKLSDAVNIHSETVRDLLAAKSNPENLLTLWRKQKLYESEVEYFSNDASSEKDKKKIARLEKELAETKKELDKYKKTIDKEIISVLVERFDAVADESQRKSLETEKECQEFYNKLTPKPKEHVDTIRKAISNLGIKKYSQGSGMRKAVEQECRKINKEFPKFFNRYWQKALKSGVVPK